MRVKWWDCMKWYTEHSVQFSRSVCVWLFVTPWVAARQASLSITNSQSPPKPVSVELVMLSNHLIVHLSVSFLFAFSCCSWGSQSKNTEVVCHSLLQWTVFCQTFPPWPIRLGWPHTEHISVQLLLVIMKAINKTPWWKYLLDTIVNPLLFCL